MAELELIHIEMFAEDGDPGWYAGRMPDGRRVHATHTVCSAGTRHWTGSVEDSDRCDCDQTEGTCRFCQIRQQGDLGLHEGHGLLPLRQQRRTRPAVLGIEPKRSAAARALQLRLDRHEGSAV